MQNLVGSETGKCIRVSRHGYMYMHTVV